ncbi:MAG: hypothetical protein ACK4N5_15020, partial [Myxococcales bacterium]
VPIIAGITGEGTKVAAEEAKKCKAAGATVHERGTYLCIEGPAFSTRAESELYRQWGVHVIGMTNMPEARLAREAELCYATVALSTDYDCWHVSQADVSVEAVLQVLHRNVAVARQVIREAARRLAVQPRGCACGESLKNAIMTAPERIPAATRKRLELIVGRHLPKSPPRRTSVARAAAAR